MRVVWRKKPLAELAELRGRIGWRGLTAKEYTDSGPLFLSVHALNYGNYVDFRDAFHISEQRYVESPEIMLQENDVLICKDGAGIGKVGIIGSLPERATINSSLLLIRSGPEISPKFLYWCLSSPYFQKIVYSRLNGATTPHLYQRDIAEFPVFVPPLSEQQRIVAVLDKAFDGIAAAKTNTQQQLENARRLFESFQHSTFMQRGTNCVQKPLGEFATFRNGINYTKDSKGEHVRIVGVKDFQNDFWVRFEDLDAVTMDGNLTELDILRRGDIFVVRSNGNLELIGRSLLAGDPPERATHSGFTIRIRLLDNEVLPHYLCHFIKSPGARKRLVEGGTGTNIKSLNQQALSALTIPIPSIAEQKEIVDSLEAVSGETQRLQSLYRQKLAALNALEKSLLHQAFTGAL